MNKKSNNTPYNFDYSRIKDKVSENLREPAPQQSECDAVPQQPKRKPLWKRVCIMVTCAVLLIALGCVGTLGVQKAFAEEKTKEDLPWYMRYAGKNPELVEKYIDFDSFVSFGGDWTEDFSAEEILGSGLLSEKDKAILQEYSKKVDGNSYSVYLVQKDSKDIVFVYYASKTLGPNDDGVFMFESNLDYAYSDILSAFEKLSGVKLTQEFLRSSKTDWKYGNEKGGIVLRFRKQICCDTYNDYGEVYFAVINEQVYCVTGEMIIKSINNGFITVG